MGGVGCGGRERRYAVCWRLYLAGAGLEECRGEANGNGFIAEEAEIEGLDDR